MHGVERCPEPHARLVVEKPRDPPEVLSILVPGLLRLVEQRDFRSDVRKSVSYAAELRDGARHAVVSPKAPLLSLVILDQEVEHRRITAEIGDGFDVLRARPRPDLMVWRRKGIAVP